MFASVVEVDDAGGLGERGGGEVPDPGGAVADEGELPDVVRAAADAFGFDQVREDARGLEGGDVAGGGPVPDRVLVLVQGVLVEEDGELDLAGAGAAVLALAVAARPGPALRRDRRHRRPDDRQGDRRPRRHRD